mgnify:CR=1 FL=1
MKPRHFEEVCHDRPSILAPIRPEKPKPVYPGRLTFYPPTSSGSGAAARFELRLNAQDEEQYDCFFLEMAAHKAGGRGEGPASFDWHRRLTVKLGFLDICEMLLVLEGHKDRIGADHAQGLYHQTDDSNTVIEFRRDPKGGGFLLGLSRKGRSANAEVTRIGMCLTDAEAVGLRCMFQSGLFFMTFHRNLRPRSARFANAP